MDLKKVSTKVLRAELRKREEREQREHWAKFAAEHPCPECGADPEEYLVEAIEEHRSAPRDDRGFPMIWAPYEMGTTDGMTYEHVLTCVNGHVTRTMQTKWFDKPVEGGPMLPRRAPA